MIIINSRAGRPTEDAEYAERAEDEDPARPVGRLAEAEVGDCAER